MKKFLLIVGLVVFIGASSATLTSCSPKVGCELNDSIGPKTNRKGELSTKRGSSSLFDKKTRKRMGG